MLICYAYLLTISKQQTVRMYMYDSYVTGYMKTRHLTQFMKIVLLVGGESTGSKL